MVYIDTEAARTHYRLVQKEGKTEFVMYGTHQQLARETKSGKLQ